MTVARIVEVAWTEPDGESLAMVTERGTAHLLDMPLSAFMWPPPRRRRADAAQVDGKPEPSASAAVSIASGALGAAYQVARPFVTASRRASHQAPTSSANSLRDSAAQGGRVIAASISHSIGKTGTAIKQLRQAGENRASLPPASVPPSAGCVTWLKAGHAQAPAVLGAGLVRIFPFRDRRRPARGGKRAASAGLPRELTVPWIPDDVVAPLARRVAEDPSAGEDLVLPGSVDEVEGAAAEKYPPRETGGPPSGSMDASIPQAEIETSAPYQPFHTDRRVVVSHYRLAAETSDEQGPWATSRNEVSPDESSDGTAAGAVSWAFGQPMASVRLKGGPTADDDEAHWGPDDHLALPPSAMERILQMGDEEQLVVTTRRRKGRPKASDDGGFFEDDCEVLEFADQRV